jgi:hypothetical protein
MGKRYIRENRVLIILIYYQAKLYIVGITDSDEFVLGVHHQDATDKVEVGHLPMAHADALDEYIGAADMYEVACPLERASITCVVSIFHFLGYRTGFFPEGQNPESG